MMNDTVARIVDLMFENAEMNDEVAALRDEVMNNCQERYNDLVSSGVNDDDAVAAVVESLRGMEDVIAQYNRKSRKTEAHQPSPEEAPASENLSGEQNLIFAADEIHEIDLVLVSEDVEVESSPDGMIHVLWNAEEDPCIHVRQSNGAIRIERIPDDAAGNAKQAQKVRVEARDGLKNAHVFVNGEEISFDRIERTMDSVGSIMENLGRRLGRIFGAVRSGMMGSSTVTIRLPHTAVPHVRLVTTSGDISVQDVALAELNITSTSGDLDIDLNKSQSLGLINAVTTSGDIDVSAYAHEMNISSTSGDAEVEGHYHNLGVSTISGDIDVRANVKNMTFKAISGDVDLEFGSDEIRSVRGSTISGDIDISLPMGIGAIAINTKTRTGDVTTRYATNTKGPMVTGDVSSMSGDITIR